MKYQIWHLDVHGIDAFSLFFIPGQPVLGKGLASSEETEWPMARSIEWEIQASCQSLCEEAGWETDVPSKSWRDDQAWPQPSIQYTRTLTPSLSHSWHTTASRGNCSRVLGHMVGKFSTSLYSHPFLRTVYMRSSWEAGSLCWNLLIRDWSNSFSTLSQYSVVFHPQLSSSWSLTTREPCLHSYNWQLTSVFHFVEENATGRIDAFSGF